MSRAGSDDACKYTHMQVMNALQNQQNIVCIAETFTGGMGTGSHTLVHTLHMLEPVGDQCCHVMDASMPVHSVPTISFGVKPGFILNAHVNSCGAGCAACIPHLATPGCKAQLETITRDIGMVSSS